MAYLGVIELCTILKVRRGRGRDTNVRFRLARNHQLCLCPLSLLGIVPLLYYLMPEEDVRDILNV